MNWQQWAWFDWAFAFMAVLVAVGFVAALIFFCYVLWITSKTPKSASAQTSFVNADVVMEREDGQRETVHVEGRLSRPLEPGEGLKVVSLVS